MEPPPELYHRYLPEPSRPAIRANQGLGLRPAPPIGTNDRWNRDYHMSHPQEMGFGKSLFHQTFPADARRSKFNFLDK